jgi:hypothetical protein
MEEVRGILLSPDDGRQRKLLFSAYFVRNMLRERNMWQESNLSFNIN